MLSIQINDIKNFMSHLLSKDTFDPFYMVESAIRMGITYHIDGHLNKDFYDTDTQKLLTRNYCTWKEVRPKIFDMIKGKRLPVSCKIILTMPASATRKLIEQSQSGFREEDIEGLYVNILYDSQNLKITTGVSYKTFSLNKSLEHVFDDYITRYLASKSLN